MDTSNTRVWSIPGQDNVVADKLSRITRLPLEDPIIQELNLLEEDFKIPADRFKQIATVHNSLVGHHGFERTCKKLRDNLTENELDEWERLFENVRVVKKKKANYEYQFIQLDLRRQHTT